MEPIASTAEILSFRMLGRSVDKKWVDWAYDMLCAGFETENLVILAGEREPFNQFEVQKLADYVFAELNLHWSDRELVYLNYTCYLVSQALDGKIAVMSVLSTATDLYLTDDRELFFQDFAMLYWAKGDLDYGPDQYYWHDATRENIDAIIEDYFRKWKEDYCFRR